MKSSLKLILLILIPLFSSGQEKEFYDLDNSYHELYKKLKVKSLKVSTKKFDNGKLKKDYIELIRDFDENGDIISEREFYDLESIGGWVAKYKYNDNHQTIKTEWTWLDDKDQELTEYEYDSENNLIRSCDYYKSANSTVFILEECKLYFYNKNLITKVTDSNNEIESYYKKKGDTILCYSSDNELESKYRNGEIIYRKVDSSNCYYERNKIGQILKATVVDNKNNTRIAIYEYSNGLLTTVRTKDEFNILSESKYQYEYFK